MIRGGRFFLVSGCLAVAGCAVAPDVKVRAIADPAAKFRYSGGLIGQGRGQLALGNPGLALETFRKAQREQPSAQAYAGIAASYAAMTRHDLARVNYEFALAYAPSDPAILDALASTLDRLGESKQALQVRGEAARLRTASAAQGPVQQATAVPLGIPRVTSTTVRLPTPEIAAAPPVEVREPKQAMNAKLPAPPAVIAKPATIAEVTIKAPAFERLRVGLAEGTLPTESRVAQPWQDIAAALVPAAAPEEAPARPMAQTDFAAPVRATFTDVPPAPAAVGKVALIERVAKDLADVPVPATLIAEAEIAVPAAKASAETTMMETLAAPRPHLERRSSGEVALVTTARPEPLQQLRQRKIDPRMATLVPPAPNPRPSPDEPASHRLVAAAVRWVPLRNAAAPQGIVLLNAARTEGLAARTRTALLNRGWRKIGIGNARKVRDRSLVLYSPARAFVAKRLAAQFRCKAVLSKGVKNVVVLLGRDAFSRRSTTYRA